MKLWGKIRPFAPWLLVLLVPLIPLIIWGLEYSLSYIYGNTSSENMVPEVIGIIIEISLAFFILNEWSKRREAKRMEKQLAIQRQRLQNELVSVLIYLFEFILMRITKPIFAETNRDQAPETYEAFKGRYNEAFNLKLPEATADLISDAFQLSLKSDDPKRYVTAIHSLYRSASKYYLNMIQSLLGTSIEVSGEFFKLWQVVCAILLEFDGELSEFSADPYCIDRACDLLAMIEQIRNYRELG